MSMKARYIVFGLLLSAALTVSARTFVANEEIRVLTNQTFHDGEIVWDDGYAVLWFYMYGPSGSEWVKLNYVESNVFVATMPAGKNYDHLILVRKNPSYPDASFSDDTNIMWNRTCDLEIPASQSCNVLYKFWKGGKDCSGYSEWRTYSPSIAQISSTISGVYQEEIEVCPSAQNTLFSLHPKIKSDMTNYDYENVNCHTWLYSTDKSSWTSLDSYAGVVRDEEYDKDFYTTLPSSIPSGGVYYYLYSLNSSGRRLIHVKVNSTGCDLDCDITSFETAISAVNADDNTYTLDGMVAFGKANGNLVISCDGVDTIITSPKSPQTFSLHGVPAATVSGKKTTATAYFVGDQTNCSKVITIDVPNAKEAIDVVTVDSLTGKTFVLTPKDYDPANKYVWFANGDTIKGASQVLIIDPYGKDSTTEYTYKEYYPASGSMDDLMENGSYEDALWDYSTKKVSDYDFWGRFPQTATTQINFYTDTLPGGVNYPDKHKDNGFAVVRNANNFYPTYAKVGPKDGNDFALFDAKSGDEGANKKAWCAKSADNSKLILQKGTTYVLSFWAANINNYGEMDNAARFKFRIEYNGKIWESKELNLADPEFRNNIWHQCSQTFYADEDCNNVTISVVNLNKKQLKVGNDFALDDIQFHPISSLSKVVKSQQKFIVNAHEPKIDAFTTTVVPLKCDEGPSYQVNIHVTFQNPKGNLVIRDVTTGVDSVYAVSAPFDTATPFDKVFTVTTNDPTHSWLAFFDGWTSAQKSSSTIIPGFPSIDTLNVSFNHPTCGEIYDTLFFDLDYTYQQGKLHFNVDGKPDSIRTVTTSKSKQAITKLFYVGVPADGKVHTLNVSFDGANSCTKSYKLPAAPFSPVIDKVEIVSTSPKVTDPKVSDTLTCSTDSYTVDVAVTLHYDPTGLGKNIQLDYNDGKNPQTKTELATGKTTTISGLTMYNIDDTASLHTVYAQLVGYTPACPDSVKYRAPIRARIQPNFEVKVSEVGCDVTNYTLSGKVEFDKADGNLVVAFIDGSKSQTISAPTGKSANFSISGVDSVGKGMQLKAWFTGSATAACEVLSKPFDSPVVPKIDTLNIKLAEPKCGEVNTTLTFDLAYTYQQGALTYWVDDMTPVSVPTYKQKQATPDTLKALSFADIPADGKSHALHVKFDGPNSCEKKFDLPKSPFSPVIDAVKIVSTSPKVTDPKVSDTLTCSTDSYKVDVEVTLHYDPTGLSKNIQLDYNDGKGPQTKTESATGKTTTISGLTMYNIDDTASLHTIYAQLVGYTPACPDSVKYRAPIRARIESNFTVKVGETTCCATNYTLSGTIQFDKADGNLVVAFLDGSKSQTITAPTGKSANFSISGVDSVGKGMQLKAWFTGSATTACEVLSKPFDSPAVPKIDTLNVKYNPLACTDLTATLLFDLDYTYQQGALTYWVDDMTPISGPTYKVKQETPDTLKALSFAGIPADGKAHTLEVKFAHANACDKIYTLPAAPFSPVINSVAVSGVPTKVFCNVNEYLAIITIKVPYDALGQKIILSYKDKGGAKDTTITVNSSNADAAGKVISFNLTLHNMDSLAQTVKAAFATSPTCTTPSAPYTPPTRMTCYKFYDTICEGENYDGSTRTPKNDFKINTPKVGLDTFTIAGLTDTLFLTVVAIPKISTGTMAVTCDDASSIHIPFTVTNGDPDTIDIKIIGCDTCKYAGTISGSDIVFTRAPELVAGDYSAWVVTGHKGSVCKDSVQVNFSIALGGAMYSKWTDVIFISNAGNQFIAYEWYENGVAMSGETMQRLYKPEGLTGTYYCRLTKTDGKVITTCEQSFDKIQPSRSVGDPAPNQVVRKYRVSPHVYIIQTIREDGFVDTKKVLTPYE